jgi:ribbon-helix-helix CopG family protein
VAGGRWYGGIVKKTSIYIEADVDAALRRRATAEGTTKAELIRAALRAAAGTAIRVKPAAAGVFEGPPDLSERVDDELAATGFGEP